MCFAINAKFFVSSRFLEENMFSRGQMWFALIFAFVYLYQHAIVFVGGVSIRQGKFHVGRASRWGRNNPRMQSFKQSSH